MLQLRNRYPAVKKDMELISNGFFKSTRNPNYLGEILIYLSFAIITGNALSYKILFTDWSILFTSFIFLKEMSLSKKKGWAHYKATSNLLLPRLFDNWFVDLAFWLGVGFGGYKFHENFDQIMSMFGYVQ